MINNRRKTENRSRIRSRRTFMNSRILKRDLCYFERADLPNTMRNAARHWPSSGWNMYDTSRCQTVARRPRVAFFPDDVSSTAAVVSASVSMAGSRANEPGRTRRRFHTRPFRSEINAPIGRFWRICDATSYCRFDNYKPPPPPPPPRLAVVRGPTRLRIEWICAPVSHVGVFARRFRFGVRRATRDTFFVCGTLTGVRSGWVRFVLREQIYLRTVAYVTTPATRPFWIL